jgi:ABC-type nitrate/sulfonate/bicarbonate transport system substrate-binding protein
MIPKADSLYRKSIIAVAVITLIVLIVSGGWYLAGSGKNARNIPTEPVTVAWLPYESGALFWIAQDRHFFEENGLNLTLKKYDSGAASLDGVVNGEADIAVGVSEFPLIGKAFENAGVRTLGNIDKGDFIYLVARKDKIRNVSDLKGKRVGTAMGTVAEFHLGRFLILNGLTRQDITLVDVRTPEGWVNDVAEGRIDAIATAQPFANLAKDRLGDNAFAWPVQSNQPVFGLIISNNEWLAGHPELAKRFLMSLREAENYLNTHPAESRTIVQERLNFDPGYMDTVWQQNQFSLTLDQSLVLAMEDEARWMISNNLTEEKTVPDFRKFIYTKILEEIKPEAVRIIG